MLDRTRPKRFPENVGSKVPMFFVAAPVRVRKATRVKVPTGITAISNLLDGAYRVFLRAGEESIPMQVVQLLLR